MITDGMLIVVGILIVAALLAMAMVAATAIICLLCGARLSARLMGRTEPVFREPPGMEIGEEDIDDLETT